MDTGTIQSYIREEPLQPLEIGELDASQIQDVQISLLHWWEWDDYANGELRIDTLSYRGALFLALEEQLVYLSCQEG